MSAVSKSLAPAALRLNTLCIRHPCLSHREQGQHSHQHALSLCRPAPRRVELGHVTRLASRGADRAWCPPGPQCACTAVLLCSREQTWTQNIQSFEDVVSVTELASECR